MTFTLLYAAVAALAASPVLAATHGPVALAGALTSVSFDEAPAVPAARVQDPDVPLLSPQMNVSDLLSSGLDGWQAYKGLPMVGYLQVYDAGITNVLTIPSYYQNDRRDDESLYAIITKHLSGFSVLLHHSARVGEAPGGVLLEVVETRSSGKGISDGWFLCVHDMWDADTAFGPGTVRVMAHPDPTKAAIFAYEKLDGKTVLKLVDSRDATSGSALGGYLMVPSIAKRDTTSDYLAIGQVSSGDGVGVTFVPM